MGCMHGMPQCGVLLVVTGGMYTVATGVAVVTPACIGCDW